MHHCAGRSVDQAGEFLRRHPEAGIDHAERLEQAALEKLIQRLARSHLDDPSQNVGAVAIFEDLTGLMNQRELCQAGHEVL